MEYNFACMHFNFRFCVYANISLTRQRRTKTKTQPVRLTIASYNGCEAGCRKSLVLQHSWFCTEKIRINIDIRPLLLLLHLSIIASTSIYTQLKFLIEKWLNPNEKMVAESRQWQQHGAVAMSALWAIIQRILPTIFSWISVQYCWKWPVKNLVCPYRLIYAYCHSREYLSKATRRTLHRWPRARIPTKCHWRTLRWWPQVKCSRFTASGGIPCQFSPAAYHFSAKFLNWAVLATLNIATS